MKKMICTKEELESIRLCDKDHNHFTSECCICGQIVDDNAIKAIKIDRRSGFDMRQYIENDYACKDCLKFKVGYFDSALNKKD